MHTIMNLWECMWKMAFVIFCMTLLVSEAILLGWLMLSM